ncbi:hypothetical protein LTS18_009238 [Coniosporium uncinatum]|uniref:Uncharacterized protein n=1 Tax=Coniosporium uncinatum TaxID=93489 RepID=A0ACC3D0Q9_9PEZI|nr:hypothetical protein LTS18_009238 [Coniosporium uncinatum]
MPGKHTNVDPSGAGRLCKRCNALETSIVVRTEPLCKYVAVSELTTYRALLIGTRDCFTKYVHTKAIKRLETFGVRHSEVGKPRKLLLPLSLGASSLSLLHIIDSHLQRQNDRTGRTGFKVHVLLVDTSEVEVNRPDPEALQAVKDQYPKHTYSTVKLTNLFLDSDPSEEPVDEQLPEGDLAVARLAALMNAIPSATSRADVLSTLLQRLTIRFATTHACEGILFGSSTTKLAEVVLSETAKGRGFAIPWLVSDGPTPFGISFYYPLRELLKKELSAFTNMTDPMIAPLVHAEPLAKEQVISSMKNTTIDFLMKQYFESVEESYPSIVANAVRTAGKLQAPKAASKQRCKLCAMPVTEDLVGIHGWVGDQTEAVATEIEKGSYGLCYGCTRSIPEEAVTFLPD